MSPLPPTLHQAQKRKHVALTDEGDDTAREQKAKEGRYIPCVIKGGPSFPEGNNTVYLIQADVERTIPLTAERLALNELEQELYSSRPLALTTHGAGQYAQISPAPKPHPREPMADPLRVMGRPHELKMWCYMPKRSEAPVEIRDLYAGEEELKGGVYWSQTETESYDGRLGLPYCDEPDYFDDTEPEGEGEGNSVIGDKAGTGDESKADDDDDDDGRKKEKNNGAKIFDTNGSKSQEDRQVKSGGTFGQAGGQHGQQLTAVDKNSHTSGHFNNAFNSYRSSEAEDSSSDVEEEEIREDAGVRMEEDNDFADDEGEIGDRNTRKTKQRRRY